MSLQLFIFAAAFMNLRISRLAPVSCCRILFVVASFSICICFASCMVFFLFSGIAVFFGCSVFLLCVLKRLALPAPCCRLQLSATVWGLSPEEEQEAVWCLGLWLCDPWSDLVTPRWSLHAPEQAAWSGALVQGVSESQARPHSCSPHLRKTPGYHSKTSFETFCTEISNLDHTQLSEHSLIQCSN